MENIESKCGDNFWQKGWKKLTKYTDPKWNLLGGLGGGLFVYGVNYEHGFLPAMASGSKQIAYNFVMAGINVRLCKELATKNKNKTKALILAGAIPSAISVGLNYLMHEFTGTPDALQSVYISLVTAPAFFSVIGYRHRRNFEMENLKKEDSL